MNVPIDRFRFDLPLWKQRGVWLSFGGFIRVVTDDAKNLEDMVDRAATIAFQEGFCQGGDRFLVTAGVPLGTPGATNLCVLFLSLKMERRGFDPFTHVFFHTPLNRLQEQQGCAPLVNVPIDRLLLYRPLWKQRGVWLSFGGFIRVVTDDAKNLEDMVDRAATIAFQEGFCQGGDRFLVTAGVPLGTPGATNLLRIASVSQDGTKGI